MRRSVVVPSFFVPEGLSKHDLLPNLCTWRNQVQFASRVGYYDGAEELQRLFEVWTDISGLLLLWEVVQWFSRSSHMLLMSWNAI